MHQFLFAGGLNNGRLVASLRRDAEKEIVVIELLLNSKNISI